MILYLFLENNSWGSRLGIFEKHNVRSSDSEPDLKMWKPDCSGSLRSCEHEKPPNNLFLNWYSICLPCVFGFHSSWIQKLSHTLFFIDSHLSSKMSERIICHILFPELKTSQHFAKLLSKSRSDAEFIPLDKFEDVNNVKIVLGDPRSLINCKNIPKTLEWVQSTWAGVDWFLPALIREYGKLEIPFKITRSAVYGKIIGEYILAQIINVERKLFKVHQNQLEGKWCRENGVLDFGTLDGRKLAVLGAGETATEFSRMLSVLDIETVANLVRTPRENSANHFTSIDTLLDTHSKKLDYLINTELVLKLDHGTIMRHYGTIMAPIMAPLWHHHGTDHGTIMAQSWHHHGTIMAPIMAPSRTIMAQSWHNHGTITFMAHLWVFVTKMKPPYLPTRIFESSNTSVFILISPFLPSGIFYNFYHRIGAMMVPWWCHDCAMICAMMVPWWCHDGAMMVPWSVPWWCHDGAMIGAMMVTWWCHDGAMMVPRCYF